MARSKRRFICLKRRQTPWQPLKVSLLYGLWLSHINLLGNRRAGPYVGPCFAPRRVQCRVR